MGALQCLQHEQVLDRHNSIVAGSSAGSIAAMAHGCGISPFRALEGTIDISDECATMGRAQGKLLPLLEEQMERLVKEQEFEYLLGSTTTNNNNEEEDEDDTNIGIAYTQVFPRRIGYLQRAFQDREDLFRAVRFSCMFPFFTTPWPCLLDTKHNQNDNNNQGLSLPRLMVDGYFSVPREQFGCPFLCGGDSGEMNQDTDTAAVPSSAGTSRSNIAVASGADRTIAISCFPQDTIGMTAFAPENCISPSMADINDPKMMELASISNLLRIATQPTSRQELTDIFELGYQNAETWCRKEANGIKQEEKRQREAARKEYDQEERRLIL
jgi:hypothetical protein